MISFRWCITELRQTILVSNNLFSMLSFVFVELFYEIGVRNNINFGGLCNLVWVTSSSNGGFSDSAYCSFRKWKCIIIFPCRRGIRFPLLLSKVLWRNTVELYLLKLFFFWFLPNPLLLVLLYEIQLIFIIFCFFVSSKCVKTARMTHFYLQWKFI